MATTIGDARFLLWDYVPWEQMSKQRRGVMWSAQLAHSLSRTLVVPPIRFHTSERQARLAPDDPAHEYEYRAYSSLFELEALNAVQPAIDLDAFAAAAPRVDLVFSLLRGMPPKDDAAASGRPPHGSDERLWVVGECKRHSVSRAPAECAVGTDGAESCTTRVDFAALRGASGLRVVNHTCGWSPAMRWERMIQARELRELPSVGLQSIVYQLPPPPSMKELTKLREAAARGEATCGWRCPYAHAPRHATRDMHMLRAP